MMAFNLPHPRSADHRLRVIDHFWVVGTARAICKRTETLLRRPHGDFHDTGVARHPALYRGVTTRFDQNRTLSGLDDGIPLRVERDGGHWCPVPGLTAPSP